MRSPFRFRLAAAGLATAAGIALVAVPTAVAAASPRPGDLDLTFGSGGSVQTTFDGFGGADARGLALQPDGKVLTVGRVGDVPNAYDFDFGVTRHDADGSPDASFGSGGQVTVDVGSKDDGAWVPLVQPDGKIVVVGDSQTPYYVVRLARLNQDGTLDPTFGSGGRVFEPVTGIGYSAALQPDGKIVVAGMSTLSNGGGFVARYTSTGTLDPSFSGDGQLNITNGSYRAVAVQADGKIVAAGSSSSGGLLVSRYDVDGQPDGTFGTGGSASTTSAELPVALWGMVLQPNGDIVASGSRGFNEAAVVRYRQDGTVDPGFGTNGVVLTDFGGNEIVSVPTLQPDGRVLVAGWLRSDDGGESGFVGRYLADGTLDEAFGTAGRVITPGAWRLRAIAVQPDGNIVVGGGYDDQTGMVVARYIGGSAEPPPTDTTAPAIEITSPVDGAAYSVGQSVVAYYSCSDPSGVATCTGTVASGRAIDTSTAGQHTLSVAASDTAGNRDSASVTYSVLAGNASGEVTDGGTVTTDPGNVGASAAVPVQTTIIAPAGVTGTLTVTPQATVTPAPTGYAMFSKEVVLTGPAATVAAPYDVRFTVDGSALAGIAPSDVQVFRNGVAVTGCTDATAAAPDPCIVSRGFAPGGDGDALVVVRTSRFSTWSLGRLAYSATGFLQPVDNAPTTNTAKAGSTIPLKFTLGGNRGLDVFATGYPRTTGTSCGSASTDEIEQTVTGSTELTYDSASGVYTYKWRTTAAMKGCRDVVLRFRDGSQLKALFSLR